MGGRARDLLVKLQEYACWVCCSAAICRPDLELSEDNV